MRDFYVLGEITEELYPTIIDFHAYLNYASEDNPISIYIDSVGGNHDVYRAFASVIKKAKTMGYKIQTTVLSRAYSSAGELFLLGDERYMYENTHLLYHWGQIEYSSETPRDLGSIVKHGERSYESAVSALMDNVPTMSRETATSIIDSGNYMFSEEALSLGIAHEIL